MKKIGENSLLYRDIFIKSKYTNVEKRKIFGS